MTLLCYHCVQPEWTSPLNIEPAVFERQARWLARHRTVLPLTQAVARLDRSGRLPRRLAALTFDDGFTALYEHVLPVLRRYRLPATVFLVAQTLTPQGQQVDWVDTPPPYPLTTLTVDQVLEMADAGVEFASHSYSHLDLTAVDPDTCVDDLRRSRELLEDLLHRRVRYLAYPRGLNDTVVRRCAATAGYQNSFTLPVGPEPVDEHGLPRVGIFQGNGMATMVVKCSRAYLPVRTHPAFPRVRDVLRPRKERRAEPVAQATK
jgi:peptidoglycan/xylan/chitin deacetylase (PgdA/CDA1 family)